MGARGVRTVKIRHDENTRAKIQVSQIVNRLTNHLLGKVELSATQVKAAEILLRKTLPDLAAIEHNAGEGMERYMAVAEPELSAEEWLKQFGTAGDHSPGHSTH